MKIQVDWDGEKIDLAAALAQVERDFISIAMSYCDDRPSVAAKLLGLKRTTLGMKLRKLRLEAGE